MNDPGWFETICQQYKAWHATLSHGELFWLSFAITGAVVWVLKPFRNDR